MAPTRAPDPQSIARLLQAFVSLPDAEACRAFLEDLLTQAEFEELAQRLEVARLLSEGGTYEAVAQATGASTATISRVRRYLFHGAGGYIGVLDRLKKR